MDMTIAEFLRLLAAARSLELEQDYWLWEKYCFDDHLARYISPLSRKCLFATEGLDMELYRQFHGVVLQ